MTKLWGSAEMSVLHLQARDHFRAVEQRDRGTLTVMAGVPRWGLESAFQIIVIGTFMR